MTVLVPELWTRSSTYRRAHRVDVFTKATLVLRDLTPGSWLIEGVPQEVRDPATGLMVANPAFADLVEGGGIIVWYGTGVTRAVLFSGRVESITETEEVSGDAGTGSRVFRDVGGSSDLAFVADRVAHPHPADLDFTIAATKHYTGAGETVLKALVNDNMGSSANATRVQANFATAADQGRGSTVTDDVRLDPIGDLVAGWSIRAGLFPSVLPVSGVLTFDLNAGVDRSASVVFAIARSNVTRIKRVVSSPGLTFEWVGGQGVGVARTFRSAENATAEALWGFRREVFRDRRDTNDTTVLDGQAAEDLAAKASNTAVQVEPLDGFPLRYGVDYALGDIVTVRTQSGISIVKAVREVKVEIDPTNICQFSPTIADPLTPGVDDLFVFNRVSNLETDLASTQAAT